MTRTRAERRRFLHDKLLHRVRLSPTGAVPVEGEKVPTVAVLPGTRGHVNALQLAAGGVCAVRVLDLHNPPEHG